MHKEQKEEENLNETKQSRNVQKLTTTIPTNNITLYATNS